MGKRGRRALSPSPRFLPPAGPPRATSGKLRGVLRLAAAVCWLAAGSLALPAALPAQSEAHLGRVFRQAQRDLKRGRVLDGEAKLLANLRRAPLHFNSHMALARLYQARGEGLALFHLNAAKSVRPGSHQVHYRLGLQLERLRRPLEAAEAYRQAIRLNARHYAANTRLRAILRNLRARKSVVERAAEQFWVRPSLALLTLYGKIVMRHSTPREALWEFESLRDRLPSLPESNLWVARAYHRLGSLPEEIAAYGNYLEGNREADGVRLTQLARMVEAWQFRSAAHPVAVLDGRLRENRLGRREAARFLFLKSRLNMARGLAAEAADLLLSAGRRGHGAGQVSRAFESDLSLYPNNPALWMAYALWLQDSGRLGTAAEAYFQAGKHGPGQRERARAALRKIAQRPALAIPAALALGELALDEGNGKEAEKFLRTVPPGVREDRRASLLLGLIHQRRGDAAKSLEALTRYVFSYDDRAGMTYARGAVLWEMGQREAAVALWSRDLKSLSAYPAALGRLAGHYRQRQEIDAEIEARRLLRDSAPGNLPNRVRLGALFEARGMQAQALAEWEAIAARKTGDFALLVRLARVYLANGRVAEGAHALRRAAQVNDLDPSLAQVLARQLLKQKQHAEALVIYGEIYRRHPEDPEVAKALPELVLNTPAAPELSLAAAKFARRAEQADLAIDILEELMERHPRVVEGQMMLARLYLAGDEPGEAERVILAGPTGAYLVDPAKLRLLADAQARLGKEMELTDTLMRLREISAGDPARDRTLGLLLARFGRMADALPLLAKALADAPDDLELLLPLARAELAEKKKAPAMKHLERYLALNPRDREVRALIIRILLSARSWQPLARHLEIWVVRHPGDERARYNLVTAYLRLFQNEKAEPHYKALRQVDPGMARRLERYFR